MISHYLNTLLSEFLGKATHPLIVIFGPTASGKTGLSLELAKQYNGEIINADSRQIYAGMDIGTAKILSSEMGGIPHHLFSFKKPNEIFTVAEYKEQVIPLIQAIEKRKNIPFLVGGTGLYINIVCYNYDIPHVEPNWAWRQEMEKKEIESPGYLYEDLQKKDPEEAQKIHPNQKRYLLRALEIAQSGKKKSRDAIKKKTQFDYLFIGLNIPRDVLYERINQRVENMFTSGLIEEVQHLLAQGYDKNAHAMTGIGYAEVLSFLQGEISKEQCIALIQQHTRNYAKRQMTWFRRMEDVHWITS